MEFFIILYWCLIYDLTQQTEYWGPCQNCYFQIIQTSVFIKPWINNQHSGKLWIFIFSLSLLILKVLCTQGHRKVWCTFCFWNNVSLLKFRLSVSKAYLSVTYPSAEVQSPTLCLPHLPPPLASLSPRMDKTSTEAEWRPSKRWQKSCSSIEHISTSHFASVHWLPRPCNHILLKDDDMQIKAEKHTNQQTRRINAYNWRTPGFIHYRPLADHMIYIK